MQPIEAHRDAGDQVRRAFYVDGYGRDVVAIAFVRSPGRDPEVRIHFVREEAAPDLAPIVAPVPADVWDLLIERSEHFDRALVPLPQPPAANEIVICMHSWVFTVEAADPAMYEGEPATIRRRTEDACENGLTEAYAAEIYRAALPLFPYCARLDARQYRTPANQLASCGVLTGDRSAAAMVMNAVDPLRRARGPDDLAEIAVLFDHRSRVTWNGEPNPTGGLDDAARYFLTRLAESRADYVYVERVDGERSDRVRLLGGLVRRAEQEEEDGDLVQRATVEMVWEEEHDDHFLIREARIGPFETLPSR